MQRRALAGIFLLLFAHGINAAKDASNLYRHVDPLIGATTHQGNTIPGPALPNGSIHPSPNTIQSSPAGYHPDEPISGFAQLHVQGSNGQTSYGTFLISPQTGDVELEEAHHQSPKAQEAAAADMYSVVLERYQTQVAVTPAHHSAIYRIAYPAGANAQLLFDITRKIGGKVGAENAEVHLYPAEGKILGRVRTKDYWSPSPSTSGSSRASISARAPGAWRPMASSSLA